MASVVSVVSVTCFIYGRNVMAKSKKKNDGKVSDVVVEDVVAEEAVVEDVVEEKVEERNGKKARVEFLRFVEVWETHAGDAVRISKILGCSVSSATAKAGRIRNGSSDDLDERIPNLTLAKSNRVKPDYAKGRELVARIQREKKSASK